MKLDDVKWAVWELMRAAMGRPTFAHRQQQHCGCEACDGPASDTGVEPEYATSRFSCEAVDDHSAASAKRAGS